jgi:hypothetical protein
LHFKAGNTYKRVPCQTSRRRAILTTREMSTIYFGMSQRQRIARTTTTTTRSGGPPGGDVH